MKKGNINVSVENIFPLIKKFLYSDHEIFLRELISNATDATLKLKHIPAYSFQGHPEASPGPHDAKYLFDAFIKAMAFEGTGDDVAVDVVKGGAV